MVARILIDFSDDRLAKLDEEMCHLQGAATASDFVEDRWLSQRYADDDDVNEEDLDPWEIIENKLLE
jgi:hypothetical protein